MYARPVLVLMVYLVNPFHLNVAAVTFFGFFERRHGISRLFFSVRGGEVRSLVDCGSLCARSPSCKMFCYSQSTALCHLSQPYDPIVQQYNGSSDFECYNPTGCPITKGYAWYGTRCIKGYAEFNNYTDAMDICTQDGGHLYHFKDLEWDLQPIVDLKAADVDMGRQLLMGADDLEIQGQYKWSDSSLLAVGSPVWIPGLPSYVRRRCVTLEQDPILLREALCDLSRRFVCQIDA